ncbi:ribonucleoside-diphosphate reductase, adenosylcobalamin-dependent [Candidatus Woesearchaeota archaeon CG10_big_fil_rev_8_21_14_0_10_34_12]|nr:MAG: ribonucleoside-diphosphate reductase, adenosylcobalamin-dependent [Candidatus Woesearchaeota archaeon CG10_big_fil_rev_8_21_14_0_10_34_12]
MKKRSVGERRLSSRKIPDYVDSASLEERMGSSGRDLFNKKYVPRDGDGNPIQSPAERIFAVASAVARVEREYGHSESEIGGFTRKFYESIVSLDFVPGGRVLANAGTEVQALANCYVLPIKDDLEQIYQTVKDAAIVHKNGGGTGYNFSRLRPRGSKVKNGVASGPVSFAGQFDKETEVINSGNRRGANMGILNIDHPDIFEFIRAKFEEAKLTNFNISVGLTDEFMDAFNNSGYFGLMFNDRGFTIEDLEKINNNISHGKAGADVGRKPIPHSLRVEGKEVYNVYPVVLNERVSYDSRGNVVVKEELVGRVNVLGTIEINAKKTLEMIAKYAHASGEPGIIFLDALERGNFMKSAGKLDTTNPCGEQPLHPYDACNLGSINLVNMLKKASGEAKIDYQKLEKTIETAVRFMDNVNDLNRGPIPKIEETMRSRRRIGLGIMGWADTLIKIGLGYDSSKALELADKVSGFINGCAKKYSLALAKEKGVFPDFDKSDLPKDDPNERVRNFARTTIAPTGSISMVAGVNSGIEPYFALIYQKKMRGGDFAEVTVPGFVECLSKNGYSKEEIKVIFERVKKMGGSCQSLLDIPTEIRDVFKVSRDISPRIHIAMQAAFQKNVDNAISKTINMPRDATVNDVLNTYVEAHRMSCKGITVYRDGSRSIQVLNTEIGLPTEKILFNRYKPRPRLPKMPAEVHTINSGCGKLFVTISWDSEGRITDVFANPNNEGGCTANLNALTVSVSKAIRAGERLEDVVDGLKGHTCVNFARQKERNKHIDTGKEIAQGSSCPSAIGFLLEETIKNLSKKYPETYKKFDENFKDESVKCPECGKALRSLEGCFKCVCGYSRC